LIHSDLLRPKRLIGFRDSLARLFYNLLHLPLSFSRSMHHLYAISFKLGRLLFPFRHPGVVLITDGVNVIKARYIMAAIAPPQFD
jgi:hypothetical protein